LLELFCGGGYLFLADWECIECGVGFGEWRVKPLEPERKNKT